MTELLNNPETPTGITTTGAPKFTLLSTPETAGDVARARQSGAIDMEQLTAWLASEQNHDNVAFDQDHDEVLTASEVSALSTRRIRALLTQAYALMDTDYPPAGAVDRYQVLADELELRVQAAKTRAPALRAREKFRNNLMHSRFELFTDGSLAAYMKYTMNGGNLTLVLGAELPGHRDQGADETLMRSIVLNAHKRRLNLIPSCPMARAFFADHPQYQQFTRHR